MSIEIELEKLDDVTLEKMEKDLTLVLEPKDVRKFGVSRFSRPAKTIQAYHVENDRAYVPFYYATHEIGVAPRKVVEFSRIKIQFTATLRPEQEEVKKEVIGLLNKNNTAILSAYPSFGKTVTTIKILQEIGLAALVIYTRDVIPHDVWMKSFETFAPGTKVVVLKPSSKKSIVDAETADVVLVSALNAPKFGHDKFRRFGVVVGDELHLIMSPTYYRCLYYFMSKYLIGLSGTAYRMDGMDAIMHLFFGKEMIYRPLQRKHTVYKILTGFVPKVEYNEDGSLNWHSVLEEQASDIMRNDIAIRIIQKYKDRVFLLMCKRLPHVDHIYERLKDLGEHVEKYVGGQDKYDTEARILVGTTGKLGVAFDNKRLDAMIVITDLMAYYIQNLARICRDAHGKDPIVFDMVDDLPTLKTHYREREHVYKNAGGTILTLDIKDI